MLSLICLIAWAHQVDRWEMVLFYGGFILAELAVRRDTLAASHTFDHSHPKSGLLWSTIYVLAFICGLYLGGQPERQFEHAPGWSLLYSLIPKYIKDWHRYWTGWGALLLIELLILTLPARSSKQNLIESSWHVVEELANSLSLAQPLTTPPCTPGVLGGHDDTPRQESATKVKNRAIHTKGLSSTPDRPREPLSQNSKDKKLQMSPCPGTVWRPALPDKVVVGRLPSSVAAWPTHRSTYPMDPNFKHLTEEEIDQFLSELDTDNDGLIEYHEVEAKLDEVSREIAPEPAEHNLHHEDRSDKRHQFLRGFMGTNENHVPIAEFKRIVQSWQIPSMEQEKKEEDETMEDGEEREDGEATKENSRM
ncbi:hypothetical protein D6D25_07955, partial [Aureobasidium pullulans]